jgi:nitrate/TMAO reductase-like tetraheme cytochrome c subunit
MGIILALLFALVSPLFATPAGAEEPAPQAAAAETSPSNDECLGCHSNEVDRSKGRAIPPIGEAFAESIHGQMGLACVDCHADLQGKDLPHPDKLAKPVCSTCHEDAVKAYGESIHASSRLKSGDSLAAWCTDCHGVHDIRSSTDPKSRTYHFNLAATCSRCHANESVIAKAHIAAGNVPARFQDSIHGRALNKMGLVVAPNCATCHGHHDIRRASDEKSRVNRYNIPKTCGSCHEGILAVYQTSVHATALREGNPRAAECADCHTAHDIQEVNPTWKVGLVKECGTCHKESIRTFRDTFHGKVTTLGFTRAATCADCHGTHAILPPTDPRSTVSDARRVSTCRKCHAGASEKFSRYDPHADAHSRQRNPVLYFITLAMKLLLISVFAFFGLHTILWLGRSLVLVRKLQAEGKIDDDK